MNDIKGKEFDPKSRKAWLKSGLLSAEEALELMELKAELAEVRGRKAEIELEEAHEQNRRDPLTGVKNLRGFEENILQAFHEINPGYSGEERRASSQSSRFVGLLYIDIDDFKKLNDDCGHPVGDEVLKAFSKKMSELLRSQDGIYRIGGEEFAVIIRDMDDPETTLRVVSNKLLSGASTINIPGRKDHITVSIGACAFNGEIENTPKNAREWTDTLLYIAKGRETVHGINGTPKDRAIIHVQGQNGYIEINRPKCAQGHTPYKYNI